MSRVSSVSASRGTGSIAGSARTSNRTAAGQVAAAAAVGVAGADRVTVTDAAQALYTALYHVESGAEKAAVPGVRDVYLDGGLLAKSLLDERTVLVRHNGGLHSFSFCGDAKLQTQPGGELRLLIGDDAMEEGALRATTDGDILLRVGAAEVVIDNVSATVISLSAASVYVAGTCQNVLFTGVFEESLFIVQGKRAVFDGVISRCDIRTCADETIIQGACVATQISRGAGQVHFSGQLCRDVSMNGMPTDATGQYAVYTHEAVKKSKDRSSVSSHAMLPAVAGEHV